MRGETVQRVLTGLKDIFQSTPLMRGETFVVIRTRDALAISIHSPHARGDQRMLSDGTLVHIISIHSPHARGDLCAKTGA